jgi:hypothetical protein
MDDFLFWLSLAAKASFPIQVVDQRRICYAEHMDERKIPKLELSSLLSMPELADHSQDLNPRLIEDALSLLREKGVDFNPFIAEQFSDSKFQRALPGTIRNNPELLALYLENSSKFSDLISKERDKRWKNDLTGLLGEEATLSQSKHGCGRTRRAEQGYRLNLDYLKKIGIDPSKVLFYRITQPSESPKPEYYWTSDYFETRNGLQVEIGLEQRAAAIIIVADLNTINENEGLIQDINDDQGMAVRQIGISPFDQNRALAKISL